MLTIGDHCYRDRDGVAHDRLPFRVRLADGSTRTDPSQWFLDDTVREETGWFESTVTADDLPPQEVVK